MKFRYFFAVGIFLLLLSLTACTEKSKELFLENFQSEVTIEKSGSQIKGTFRYISPDEMNFTVSSPEEMKGTMLNVVDEEFCITVGDLSMPLSQVSTGKDVFLPLFEAVSHLASSQTEIKDRGENTLTFTASRGEYELIFSSDEMKILSFKNNGTTYNFQYQ